MIAVASFGVEPTALRECFEKGGFAAAIFAHEEADFGSEGEIDPVRERADVERMSAGIHLLWKALDSVEKRRASASHGSAPPPRLHRPTMPRAALEKLPCCGNRA